jgi:hypothetical protein
MLAKVLLGIHRLLGLDLKELRLKALVLVLLLCR